MGFGRFFVELVASVIVSVVVSLSVLFGILYVLSYPERFSQYIDLPFLTQQHGAAPATQSTAPPVAVAPAAPAASTAPATTTGQAAPAASTPAAAVSPDSIVIGTGGVTGVYYPSGGAICQMVNQLRTELGISCARESTNGSVYNIETIRAGGLDVGIAQSDWQYHAYRGSDRFEPAGPFTELRALFSLHSEPFTVVARADAGVLTFEDLRGKRVNVGIPGSGQRGTLELLMSELGWDMSVFAEAREIEPAEQSNALCSGEIDAFVYTVGHPSSAIQEAMSTCDSVLVEVSGPAIDNLISTRPYYATAVIPAGLYRNHDSDVATFGVKATVVTSTRLRETTAYGIVKSVFENLPRMQRMHPSFTTLEARSMISDGNSVPPHPGAARYFREAGLM
jgi:uncharacterized protein